jgi:hypothetical protein
MHRYVDSVLGEQVDGGARFDATAGEEVEMKLLLNHGEQQSGPTWRKKLRRRPSDRHQKGNKQSAGFSPERMASSRRRSGSNESGLEKKRGSRCLRYWKIKILVPPATR